MKALLSKEWAAQWPFFAAVAVLFATDLWALVFHGRFEVERSTELELDIWGWVLVGGGVITWATHASVQTEVRGEHFEFLDGLPVSRLQIFAAKAAVMLGLVAAVTAAILARTVLWWSFVATADGPSLAPVLSRAAPLLLLALTALGALGSVTGWVGSAGLVVATLVLFTVEILAVFNPSWHSAALSSLVTLRFEGSALAASPGRPEFWAGLTAAAVLISGAATTWRAEARVNAAVARLRRLSAATGVLAGGAVILLAGATMLLGRDRLTEIWERPTARAQVPGFDVYFAAESDPDASLPSLDALLPRLPELEREVAAFFSEATLPKLDVEVVPRGGPHLGKYSGGKIRLDLSPSVESTLVHELAHAHAFNASGMTNIPASFGATRFFHEGSASWIEARVMGERSSGAADQTLAASLFRDDEHHLADLLDGRRRATERAVNELYALGHAFVEALATTYGEGVVACLARAEGASGFQRADGPLLWADLAARCDVDLEAVSRAYRATLEDWAGAQPAVRVEPRVRIVRRGETTSLEVLDLRNQRLPLSCRFRLEDDTPEPQIRSSRVENGRCDAPSSFATQRAFWFQVGYDLPTEPLPREESDTVPRFGPWIRAERAEALPCSDLRCARQRLAPWSEPEPWSLAPLDVQPHADAWFGGAVTHDDRYLIFGFEDAVVEVLDAQTGRPVARWFEPHADLVSVQLSPDETLLLVEYRDRWVMWSVPDGRRQWRTSRAFRAATFLPDRRGVLTVGPAGASAIRDAKTGEIVAAFDVAGAKRVNAIRASRRNGQVLARTDDREVVVFSSELDERRKIEDDASGFIELLHLRDGRAVYQRRDELFVADLATAKIIFRADDARHGALMPDGTLLLAKGSDGASVVRLSDGQKTSISKEFATDALAGREAAFISGLNRWWRYDRSDLQPLAERPTAYISVRTSTGSTLAVYQGDRIIRFLDVETCETRRQVENVRGWDFELSPAGRFIAIASGWMASGEGIIIIDRSTGARTVWGRELGEVEDVAWVSERALGLLTADAVFVLDLEARALNRAGPIPEYGRQLIYRSDRSDFCALSLDGVRCFDARTGERTLDFESGIVDGWAPFGARFFEAGRRLFDPSYPDPSVLHLGDPESGPIDSRTGGRLIDEEGNARRFPPYPGATLASIHAVDDRRVAMETNDHVIIVFNFETHQFELETKIHDTDLAGLAGLPGTDRVVTWTDSGELAQWSRASGEVVCRRRFR